MCCRFVLQLVLLSIILVRQRVAAASSDKQALQTHEDAKALLELIDGMHRLLKQNFTLTEQINVQNNPAFNRCLR